MLHKYNTICNVKQIETCVLFAICKSLPQELLWCCYCQLHSVINVNGALWFNDWKVNSPLVRFPDPLGKWHSSQSGNRSYSPLTALSVRKSDIDFTKWILPHLLIDVSIIVMSDPHFLIFFFLVIVLVGVVGGIVGLHLGQRRTDVAEGRKFKLVFEADRIVKGLRAV